MGTNTKIEWADATWNPIIGCSRVSEGCRNCYAETIAGRFGTGKETVYSGLTQIVNGRAVWTGKIAETKQLLQPLSWRTAKRVFVGSMSDLFHENVTEEMLCSIFKVMCESKRHIFQVLTKRPQRMLDFLSRWDSKARDFGPLWPNTWPQRHIWLGVSVENQATADERIPLLLQTPAAVRFISAEPLLGPIDLAHIYDGIVQRSGVTDEERHTAIMRCVRKDLHWAIVGGESGPRARPMHPDWARSLRDQCADARVPFFFKQWGEWAPYDPSRDGDYTHKKFMRYDGRVLNFDQPNPDGLDMRSWTGIARPGKKAAGAMLDGREHREFPKNRPEA